MFALPAPAFAACDAAAAEVRKVRVCLDACFSGDSHQGMLIRPVSPLEMSAACRTHEGGTP